MKLLAGTLEIEDVEAVLAEFDALEDRYGTTIQAFDGHYVAGRTHLERAVELADRAIDRDEAIARDRGVEILLYAAGRRQIEQALEMGLSPGPGPVVILVDGGDEAGAVAEITGFLDEKVDHQESLETGDSGTIESFFGITTAEREVATGSREGLVCERVALLAVER